MKLLDCIARKLPRLCSMKPRPVVPLSSVRIASDVRGTPFRPRPVFHQSPRPTQIGVCHGSCSGLVARACRCNMASLSRHVLRPAGYFARRKIRHHARHRPRALQHQFPSPTMSTWCPGRGAEFDLPSPSGRGWGWRSIAEWPPPLPAPCPSNSAAPQTSATNSHRIGQRGITVGHRIPARRIITTPLTGTRFPRNQSQPTSTYSETSAAAYEGDGRDGDQGRQANDRVRHVRPTSGACIVSAETSIAR